MFRTFRFLFDPFCSMGQILLLVVPWFSSLREKYCWRSRNERLDLCPTPSPCSGVAGGKNLLPQEADSSSLCPLHPSRSSRNSKPRTLLLYFPGLPLSLLAAGVRPAALPGSPLLSSITCPMLLPGSCQPHEENEFFYLSQSNRFGFCLHTCNSCSGSAPVPGVPRDSHSGLIRLLRTVTAL